MKSGTDLQRGHLLRAQTDQAGSFRPPGQQGESGGDDGSSLDSPEPFEYDELGERVAAMPDDVVWFDPEDKRL